VCPETTRYFHKHGGYAINAQLRGKALSKIPHPEQLLLIADALHPNSFLASPSDIDTTRHGNHPRGFIGTFLDGHTEFISADKEVTFTAR
jgi:hypothetical protein